MSVPPIVIQPGASGMTPGGAVPPGYQVPRQTRQGMQNVTPQPMFTGPPVDMVPQIIKREDFPPGPEGDEMYAAALQTLMNQPARIVTGFDEAGNPIYGNVPGGVLPNGRTGSEQAAGNFQRSGDIFNYAGGLNVQNRASIRPEEAQQALFANQAAMANGGQGRPELLQDDATIRNIVTGLGGQQAVQDIGGQVRQDMMDQGVIPEFGPEHGNVGQEITVPEVGTFSGIGGEDWIGPDNRVYRRDERGFFVLAEDVGIPNEAARNQPPMTDEQVLNPGGSVPPPPGSSPGSRIPPGVEDIQAPPAPSQSAPDVPFPDGGFIPPHIMDKAASPYQYTQEGADVFLDVTADDGATHRFTGDVVEAAYTMHGYSSFDEMVLDMGYSNAVAALFSFIAPPAPPTQQAPAPQPTQQVTATPPPPPPPVNPNQGTTGQPGGKGPSFF